MDNVERKKKILEILKEKKHISIKELADLTGFSPVTIRRDVRELEGEGALQRSWGYVFLPEVSKYELSFREREKEYAAEKKRIAQKALKFLRDGMTIGLDAGTTTLFIAKEIGKSGLNLTVVTPCLPILQLATRYENLNVLLLGGKYDPENLSFVGPITIQVIEKLHFDIAFIGASAVIPERGLFTTNPEGAEVDRKLALSSDFVVGVFDHSKFFKKAPFLSVESSLLHLIITDHKSKSNILQQFPDHIKIILA